MKTCSRLLHMTRNAFLSLLRHLRLMVAARKAKKLVGRFGRPTIELGAGGVRGIDRGSEWVTFDTANGSDVFWDLLRGIPLEDCSVSSVYTSHCLEHLHFHDIVNLLKECHRVLRPGGTISVSVPSARIWVDAYIHGTKFTDDQYVEQARALTGSPIDELNYIAYMGGGSGGHKYMFDIQNLHSLLRSAGFCQVQERERDMELETAPHHISFSLFAVGVKL